MLGAHDNSGGSDWVYHKLLTSVHVMLILFLLSWGQMGGRNFKIPQEQQRALVSFQVSDGAPGSKDCGDGQK